MRGRPPPISGSAAALANRTSPSGPTTITASSSASKIADSRSRSDDSALNVSRSARRIVSSAVPSSVISSRPPVPSSGSSSWPSVIRAALCGQALDAGGDRAGDQEADHDRDADRDAARRSGGRRGLRRAPPGSPRAARRGRARPRPASPRGTRASPAGSRRSGRSSTVREPRWASRTARRCPGTSSSGMPRAIAGVSRSPLLSKTHAAYPGSVMSPSRRGRRLRRVGRRCGRPAARVRPTVMSAACSLGRVLAGIADEQNGEAGADQRDGGERQRQSTAEHRTACARAAGTARSPWRNV